jgi:hypothetical protein
MKALRLWCLIGATVLLIVMTETASAQLEPTCVANSPERRGESSAVPIFRATTSRSPQSVGKAFVTGAWRPEGRLRANRTYSQNSSS